MKTVYLDHSATTPVDPEVLQAMLPYFTENFGNASSQHSVGQEAYEVVENARKQVAQLINADPNEIFFTSGGTEADNMAIRGAYFRLAPEKNHIITAQIEHHAVLHTVQDLVKNYGATATYLPVDENGIVNPADLEKVISDKTSIVTIMMANNEVGAIQPVEEIARICRSKNVYFHTDAVQAIGKIPVDVKATGIDLLSISSHKFYGPKGIGAIYVRKGVKIRPMTVGGGQEKSIRPGTYNTPGIVGMGMAAQLAMERLAWHMDHTGKLRDELQKRIVETIPDVKINCCCSDRLPQILNVSIRYCEGEAMLMLLDMDGNIQASSGSACTSQSLAASHVLLAMCVPHDIINGSIRFSFGKDNTMADVDRVMDTLPKVVEKLRAMSAIGPDKEIRKDVFTKGH
jgi:cysteine desulfurase